MNKSKTPVTVSVSVPIPVGYLSKRGYVLKKEQFTPQELLQLKTELRARPLVDTKFNAPGVNAIDSTFPMYIETKNKIYIPKMYGISKYGLPDKMLDNYIGNNWETDIPFTGTLYPRQIEPVNKLIESCKKNGGGILSLSTGGGKTISSLAVLAELKGKTIIVVNKIPLMKQWELEIKQFLPNAKVAIIQGQKINNDLISKSDITIAMLQSLARIDYPDSLFEDYQCVVIDEIHNTASRVFSQILFKLCCKYTIGLSATPKRSDGCEYVFKWHIGEIVYKSTTERKGLDPIIRLLKIDSSDYKEINSINKFTGQKQIQFTSMLSELVEMPKRNALIIELIKDLVTQKRKILVLSDRRGHLTLLKKELNNQKVKFTYDLFVGGMKIKDLDISKSCDVILATVQAFGEGVSVAALDTMILCTPKKFVGHIKTAVKADSGKLEQIVGRIFRREHIDISPLIIDLFDNFSVYKNQSAGRKIFYKQHFTNGIFEDQSINLDETCVEKIDMSCIKNKKKSKAIETDSKPITQFCLLE